MAAYETPTNEVSFSGVIDQALKITGRASAIATAVGAANAAVRECQLLGLLAKDGVEDVITATTSPFVWTPESAFFRTLATVRYQEQDIWPKFKRPGKQQRGESHLYYGTDDYYVFKGPLVGETLEVYYFRWLPPLQYYQRPGEQLILPGGPYDTRPAYYDSSLDLWFYWDGTEYVLTLGSDVLNYAARAKSSNWIINKWNHVILEGIKGKLWSSVNDERGKTSYSLYQSYLQDMKRGEEYEAEGF